MKVTDLRYGVKVGSTLLLRKVCGCVLLDSSCLGSWLSGRLSTSLGCSLSFLFLSMLFYYGLSDWLL